MIGAGGGGGCEPFLPMIPLFAPLEDNSLRSVSERAVLLLSASFESASKEFLREILGCSVTLLMAFTGILAEAADFGMSWAVLLVCPAAISPTQFMAPIIVNCIAARPVP